MRRQTDSRTVKAVWSIILGLAMVLGQFANAEPSVTGGEAMVCACCSCAQFNCCTTNPVPVPLTAPAPRSERVDAPAVVVMALFATPLAAKCAIELLPSQRSFSHRTAVPVYDWHCSYLI